MRRFALREHVSSILVAALSSAFGVALLQVTDALSILIGADPRTGASTIVGLMLTIVAFVFIFIAVYVGAVVTANTFATIIAGRTRTLALLRLIGSSAAPQRRAVATEGLTVGAIGAVVGAAIGTGLSSGGLAIAVGAGWIEPLPFRFMQPVLLLPIAAVVLTTWLASWIGSRRVLVVSPVQATGAAEELTAAETRARRGRTGLAVTLFVAGTAILMLGVLVGLVHPGGVLIGLVGGVFSFTGLVLGAELIMPPALRLVGRAFGSAAPARLAALNAVRYPERSSRTTIGLVIGVTLVTMFAVATQSYQTFIRIGQQEDPAYYQGIDSMFAVTVIVLSVLTGFSAFIAAIGMVNNLSLSVLQRTRELGLLRALGFTARQVRAMILAESAQLTVTAVLVGLLLGTFYGWAGAQALLGSINGSPGFIVPAVPPLLLVVVAMAAAVLTWIASIVPARRATRVAPVAALATQ